MALEIVVPEVSDGVTSGTVISIAVAVGDQVETDQTLLELETDKAVVAIPSPGPGTITEIRVAEGDSAAIGSVIMLLEPAAATEVESVADKAQDAAPEREPLPSDEDQRQPAGTEAAPVAAPLPPAVEIRESGDIDLTSVRRDGQVAPAAPSVRRMARDLGVDIYQVRGSGPGGRISKDDIRLHVRTVMQQFDGGNADGLNQAAGLSAQRALPDFSQWGEITREPLSRVRELTADSMSYAWATIPMVTQYDKVNITDLETFRRKFNNGVTAVDKLTLTAILVKVCAAALKAFPQFNSSLDLARKELILKQYVHVGVAVDTPGGLLVPVIRNADQKGIEALASELNRLAETTRTRKISPADMEGGTFTISNLGGIGGTAFTPIVYAPQVAILGVSRAETQPVWDGGGFVPRQIVTLSLSYDHRVIDVADGARFLRWICEAIENPIQLLM